MVLIRDMSARTAMREAGALLSSVFTEVVPFWIREGVTTAQVDVAIDAALHAKGLVSQSKGYRGYRHSSCISVNDVVVHGIPSSRVLLRAGDLVKVDVCAAYMGYCADMARCFVVGGNQAATLEVQRLIKVSEEALFAGIAQAVVGARVGNISHAVQTVVERARFGVVRDFAGHGIGKSMHEEPEILNYGVPGRGVAIVEGMGLAIEPMVTIGSFRIAIDQDGWTARTIDGSWAAHVEDTVLVTDQGPCVVTRPEAA